MLQSSLNSVTYRNFYDDVVITHLYFGNAKTISSNDLSLQDRRCMPNQRCYEGRERGHPCAGRSKSLVSSGQTGFLYDTLITGCRWLGWHLISPVEMTLSPQHDVFYP